MLSIHRNLHLSLLLSVKRLCFTRESICWRYLKHYVRQLQQVGNPSKNGVTSLFKKVNEKRMPSLLPRTVNLMMLNNLLPKNKAKVFHHFYFICLCTVVFP